MRLRRPGLAGARVRPAVLAGVVVIQALAAAFFLGDVAADLAVGARDAHSLIEAGVTLALALGIVFGAVELARTIQAMRGQEAALRAAAGALGEVIADAFRDWRLTPAEADVALFALKGLDVADIAGLRGAATGTVRAQLASIYAKAGVSGRAQFAALFVEDLLALLPAAPPPAS